MIDLFPFNLIEKGSTILLYGLGKCGHAYFEQNKQLKWCNIKYVSDKVKPIKDFENLYIKPEDISTITTKVDKIVIAISRSSIVRQVKEQMIKDGIAENMIISAVLEDEGISVDFSEKALREGKKSKILLVMLGGLGDYVVFLSFYQRLMDYLPDAEIVIQGREAFIDALYGQKTNVKIIPEGLEIKNQDEFDCILELNHFIKVIWYNPLSLPETLVKKLEAYEAEYEGKYKPYEMRDALFIRRMIIAGRNRYDALGGGKIFDLNTVKLKIEYTEYGKKRYDLYNLKQYVTFNFGSDRLNKTGTEQLKVWPKEYYIKWIEMFKERYPAVEVVQIGANDVTRIEGADRYILGEQFEVVKYILRNAIFHLDCEGGLVHLATAIGTKCIVLFGPTPLEYYAYPQNINLYAGVCNGCMDLLDNWYYECINRNKQYCMYSITPESVMGAVNLSEMREK